MLWRGIVQFCLVAPVSLMSKVYPSFSLPSKYPSPFDHASSKPETFTIWMKSLILNGNGCTVYNSKGKIAYRVDNYDNKCRGEVYLMNLGGKILFKIVKKKLWLFRRWEGYKYIDGVQKYETRPWFKVKKPYSILQGSQSLDCEIQGETGHVICCKIIEQSGSSFKITGISGELLAEVKRKQTASGVDLGNDVHTLVIEPKIDQSLIMGLVVVLGLMKCRM